MLFLVAAIPGGLFISRQRAEAKSADLKLHLEVQQHRIQGKEKALQNTQKRLHEIEQQKAKVEHEANLRGQLLQQKDQEIQHLNGQLQSKRRVRATYAVAQVAPAQPQKARVVAVRTAVAGNTYTAGYCTHYAKAMRPDLPNSLGNAHTWAAKARALGLPVGAAPRVGAIAVSTRPPLGHVAYVTAVHGDGTITVSEKNYKGFNIVSSRKAPASSFGAYIY